ARTVAALGDVGDAGRRAAEGAGIPGRVLARDAGAVALIDGARVAVVGAGRARSERRVRGAIRPGARADLRGVAFSGGATAQGTGRREGIGGARGGRAVADLRNVARACGPAGYGGGLPGAVAADGARAAGPLARCYRAV